jgi:hypothetical protein
MTEIEPKPEDYEAARRDMERPAREIFLEVSARQHARKRIERERLDRRRRFLRRLFPFRHAT